MGKAHHTELKIIRSWERKFGGFIQLAPPAFPYSPLSPCLPPPLAVEPDKHLVGHSMVTLGILRPILMSASPL